MQCKKCGKEIIGTGKFCPNCGFRKPLQLKKRISGAIIVSLRGMLVMLLAVTYGLENEVFSLPSEQENSSVFMQENTNSRYASTEPAEKVTENVRVTESTPTAVAPESYSFVWEGYPMQDKTQYSATEMLNMTSYAIMQIFQKEISINTWDGGYNFTYEDEPYQFYFSPDEKHDLPYYIDNGYQGDERPKSVRVHAGGQISKGLYVGMTLDELSAAVVKPLTIEYSSEYDDKPQKYSYVCFSYKASENQPADYLITVEWETLDTSIGSSYAVVQWDY